MASEFRLIIAVFCFFCAHLAPSQSFLNGCPKVPPIDPAKDFFGNFNNSCYASTMPTSNGRDSAGDLNALSSLAYYKVTPGYEIIVAGNFPNARFFSVTVNDAHAAVASILTDGQILPLNGLMSNPFQLFTNYLPNQHYALKVSFGSGLPVTVAPGCSTSATTLDKNLLDASQLHQGISWNGYPNLPVGFPVHITGANIGGSIIVRRYESISSEAAPVMILRQLSNGCAVPLKNVSAVMSGSQSVGATWNDQIQTSAHDQFAYTIEPLECFPPDPLNHAHWSRSADYVPGNNDDAAYLSFPLSSTAVASIISSGQFIRMRFQLPLMPNTPCATANCSLSGTEQLRYRSISFLTANHTIASITDSDLIRDPAGNVTLVMGMGTPPPPTVTSANFYTYYDLSQNLQYRSLVQVDMRDILPSPSFGCSGFNVPYLTKEFNPEGGYMGNFVPTVDYPTASQLPAVSVPMNRANTCAAVVPQIPVACGTQH